MSKVRTDGRAAGAAPEEEKRGSSRTAADIRNFVRNIPFAVATVWRHCRWLVLIFAVSTLVRGFAPTAMVWISRYVLNSIAAAISSAGAATDMLNVFRMIGLELSATLAFMLAGQVNGYVLALMGGRLNVRMTSDVLKRLSQCEMVHFDDPQFYNTVSRAVAEAGGKPLVLIGNMSSIVSNATTFLSMSSIVVSFCWPLVFLMALFCLPYLAAKVKFSRVYYRIQYARTEDQRMAGYLSSCLLTRECIPEISSFGLWDYLHGRWRAFAERFLGQDMQLTRQRTLAEGILGGLLDVGKAGVMGYILYRGIRQPTPLPIGDLLMYSSAFGGGVGALGRLFDSLAGMYENSLFLQNLREFQNVELERERAPATARPPTPEQVHTIELRHVSFRYPGSTVDALRNVDLTFVKGQSVLIVGRNGAGKSSLIKLLFRLYDPTHGSILLDGIDIREYEVESLRRRIGVIFQDFLRYPFSASENIGMGLVGEVDNLEAIQAAARVARADSIIDRLPAKYATVLSRQFRGGCDLSVGQWQRVCLARLFMKDAPVLIFDEPSASLDVDTETSLLAEISALARAKLCILVSHRMLRSDVADRIIVMDQGAIIEEGDHDSLLDKKGAYARLWSRYHSLSRSGDL